MIKARQGLPIIGMEQEIVEMVHEHDVVVLCGETGCGKTTQVMTWLHVTSLSESSCLFVSELAAVVGYALRHLPIPLTPLVAM